VAEVGMAFDVEVVAFAAKLLLIRQKRTADATIFLSSDGLVFYDRVTHISGAAWLTFCLSLVSVTLRKS
jgi:hypothetical protein